MDEEKVDNNTCERLEVDVGGGTEPKKNVFVRGTWESTSFSLAVFDGLRAWTFDGINSHPCAFHCIILYKHYTSYSCSCGFWRELTARTYGELDAFNQNVMCI